MSLATTNPIAELQADHRVVRDILLSLIDVAPCRDALRALELIVTLDKAGGPHFRFEEESLYPGLERFFGTEYLLGVHDRIISSAEDLAELLGKGEISKEDARRVPDVIRNKILPHPIECDGLALLAEKLNKEELGKIAENVAA